MESTMQSQTIPFPLRRFGFARLAVALRALLRRARVPAADDLPPHIRRDVGLPPEVYRPTHAPPRVF
jgi:hypothetical protein